MVLGVGVAIVRVLRLHFSMETADSEPDIGQDTSGYRLAIADTIVPQLDNTLHPAPPRDKDTAGHCPFVKPNFLFLSLENILTQQGLKQITDFLE